MISIDRYLTLQRKAVILALRGRLREAGHYMSLLLHVN